MEIEEEEPEEDPPGNKNGWVDNDDDDVEEEEDDEPEAEDADDELEVEEAGVKPEAEGADVELKAEEPDGVPEDVIGAGVYETGESSTARDPQFVGGLAPIMPPKQMSEARMRELIRDQFATSMNEFMANMNSGADGPGGASGSSGAGGSGGTGGNADGTGVRGAGPTVPELTVYTYATFIKCDQLPFIGTKGAVKKWITKEFCPRSVIQRTEQELYNLRMKGMDIDGYTNRFHELAVLYPRMVEPEAVKVEQYIRGLAKNIRGDVTSSQPVTINGAVRLAYQLAGQLIKDKADEATEGEKERLKVIGEVVVIIDVSTTIVKTRREGRNGQGGNNHGSVYQLGAVNAQEDPKVVTGMFLLNNHYATVLFDSGADRSFISTKFSTLINIKPVEIDTNYEVELADGKVVSTHNVLKGCTINLLNHSFPIDLMVIELGSFDVVIGMDWLSKNDAAILCGEKKVRIPLKNKALIIEGDKNQS
nr:reverse transcriptase domain-containing protein [Tanacetum cinerariifolium]